MDWRRIQIFNLIASHVSFTAASKKLKKSQSTLSRDIINLEKKIGFKVFKRSIRGIKLTEEGQKLLTITKEFNPKLTLLNLPKI